jgi:hypothetical protein
MQNHPVVIRSTEIHLVENFQTHLGVCHLFLQIRPGVIRRSKAFDSSTGCGQPTSRHDCLRHRSCRHDCHLLHHD